jgi:hypothetical protein
MTVEYSVQVSDETAEELEQIREEEIETALVQTLEGLADRDEKIQQQQDELHDRMGISSEMGESEELSESELKHEIQRFLRGERKTDPRLDN